MVGAPTETSVVTAIDDRTITVASATGFVDGLWIGMFGQGRFFFAGQVGAASANVITLDTPLDFAFDAGTPVFKLTRDMNVDGSVTPQIFLATGPGIGEIDITRIMIKMLTDSAVSLAKFGDLTKLTNGVVFRKVGIDETRNIWNVKDNGEIANLTFDFNAYLATNPSQGQNGALFRNTYAGAYKHGVALRLESGESLQMIIQDDLSGLDLFRVIAQGHLVTD